VVSPARLVLTVHRLPQLIYSHDIAEKSVKSDDKIQYKRTPNKYGNHDLFGKFITTMFLRKNTRQSSIKDILCQIH
jgi:hypothetical protein